MTHKTNIIKDGITIIALSDIHADIHALIIALRDCAKVIKKKDFIMFNPTEFNFPDEKFLEYDLNCDLDSDGNIKKDPFYKDDLNYEWCGGETYVVICGDFLDGSRYKFGNIRTSSTDSRCENCKDSEYDQVEIKIFRLINAINQDAMTKKGRIFKILGNHEIINLNNSLNNYIPTWTKSLQNYYKGMTRTEYFKLTNEGSDLIFKDGAWLVLKINQNIFVHGRLDHSKTFADYVDMNNILNLPNNHLKKKNLIIKLNSSCTLTTWGRRYNSNFNNSENENDLSSNQTEKCKQIKDYLKMFISGIKNNNYSVDDIRVIVGHCPQYLNHYSSTINSTFTTIEKNGQSEKVSLPVRTSIADIDQNFVFGIGMECNKKSLDDHDDKTITIDNDDRYIYKIDVGSSRGFDDNLSQIPFSREYEKANFGARTPQVLEIKYNGINILRSTIKNTRIHQPRQKYEEEIRKNAEHILNLINPYYNKKYVKS